MLTAKTTTLNLVDCWLDSDPDHARVHVNFPLNKAAGTDGGAVVYFKVRPRGVPRAAHRQPGGDGVRGLLVQKTGLSGR